MRPCPANFVRFVLVAALLPLLPLLPAIALGETWTDSTGSFSVEATFVGVEGRSVVLRKPNGSVIQVPIDRLSDASRATAKRLFEEQKKAAPNPQSGQPVGTANAARASYPVNGTLEQAADFVLEEFKKGNFSVGYLVFPKKLREYIDTQEMRDELAVTLKNYEAAASSVESILDQSVTLFTTKKTFILNSQIKQVMPPEPYKQFTAHYDDLVSFLKACRDLVADRQSFGSQLPSDFVEKHGNQIGSYAKIFIFDLPFTAPAALHPEQGRVVQDGDSGELQYTNATQNTRWQLVDGYWIMEHFALMDLTMGGDYSKLLDELRAFNEQPTQMAAVAAGMINGFASGALQPMLEAKNQAEFDQAVVQASAAFAGLEAMFMPQPQ